MPPKNTSHISFNLPNHTIKRKNQKTPFQEFFVWLRESDSNRRPQGYGPCELPTALSRDGCFKKRSDHRAQREGSRTIAN